MCRVLLHGDAFGVGGIPWRVLQIASQLRFLDLHFKRTVDDVRKRSCLSGEVVNGGLVAFPDVVVQKRAGVELGKELNILVGQIAVR